MDSLILLEDKYLGVQVEKVIISLFFPIRDKIKINNNYFKLENVYQEKDLNLTLIDLNLVPSLSFINIKEENENIIGKVINLEKENNIIIGNRKYQKSELIPYLEIKYNQLKNGIVLNSKKELVSILTDEKRAIPIDIIQRYYHFIINRKQNIIKKIILPFKFIRLNNEYIIIESEIEQIKSGNKIVKINDTLLENYHPYEFLLFYEREIKIEFSNNKVIKIN